MRNHLSTLSTESPSGHVLQSEVQLCLSSLECLILRTGDWVGVNTKVTGMCGRFIKMLIRANRGKKFSEELGRWSGSVLQV